MPSARKSATIGQCPYKRWNTEEGVTSPFLRSLLHKAASHFLFWKPRAA